MKKPAFRQVLDLIFERCALQTLDVSWSGEFTDAPWSRAPVTCPSLGVPRCGPGGAPPIIASGYVKIAIENGYL